MVCITLLIPKWGNLVGPPHTHTPSVYANYLANQRLINACLYVFLKIKKDSLARNLQLWFLEIFCQMKSFHLKKILRKIVIQFWNNIWVFLKWKTTTFLCFSILKISWFLSIAVNFLKEVERNWKKKIFSGASWDNMWKIQEVWSL